MHRTLLLALAVTATACVPGTIEDGSTGGGGGNAGPDAATGGTTHLDGGTGAGAPDGAASACRNQVVAGLGNGHHNPGQDCMNGCHNHGFTLSGTLYSSAAGATAVTGGSITVTDAAGKTFDMVSQTNGNFYTTTAVTFPVTVVASSCPSIQHMAGSIAAGSGGCNMTGCHTAAGQGRVHL
jgi:hypothetical protein